MLETNAAVAVSTVAFTLNGKTAVGRADRTILQTAQAEGVEIPRLCYMEGMRADGNCRTCMVEIKGERVLAPSCCRYPKDGMEVTTNSARALTSQKMSLELLLADVPEASYTRNSELDRWAKKLSLDTRWEGDAAAWLAAHDVPTPEGAIRGVGDAALGTIGGGNQPLDGLADQRLEFRIVIGAAIRGENSLMLAFGGR